MEALSIKVLAKRISIAQLVAIAMALKSDDGENNEYDRALVETIIEAAGLSHEQFDAVYAELGMGEA